MRALLLLLTLVSATAVQPAAGQPAAADPCIAVLPSSGERASGEETAHGLRQCHTASAGDASRGAARLAETVDRQWNWDDAAWENDIRSTYTYSETGALTELSFEAWDGSVWTTDSRYLYLYDDAGLRTELVAQRWDEAAWANDSRLTYTYDAGDRLTVLIIQRWIAGAWANVYRYTSSYGAGGRLTGDLVQQWNGTTWTNQYRFSYAYDEAGNRSHDLFQTWTGDGWSDNSQNFFIYTDNRLAEDLFQRWDGTEWRHNDRRQYAYEVEGYDTEVVSQQWIALDTLGTTYDWAYTGRNLIAYDEAGDQTENLFQLRHWDGGSWVDNSRDQTVYNMAGDPVEDLEQDWDLSTWLNRAQRLYTYQSPTAHESPSSDAGLVLIAGPNPTSGSAVVRFARPTAGEIHLTLHDVLGRTVATLYQGQGQAGAVSVESLPAGIYWVRFSSGGASVTQSLTVVR